MDKNLGPPDPSKVLNGLKDFQRDSVEYVFRRMYLDDEFTRRFLVADEVGLGKTLVARGIIARAVSHLWDRVPQIDVVYICSNADIARQNINRLNVTGQDDFTLASRITLLPIQVHNLRENRLNFVSFTPGTSFNLRSSLGLYQERILLYWLLDRAWDVRSMGTGPLNLLQGGVQDKDRFRRMVRRFRADHDIDDSLTEAFVDALRKSVDDHRRAGRPDLRSRFEELCDRFGYARKHIPDEDASDRNRLVGDLRALLARTCVHALEPDLIILDEFQRFKYLLEGEDETSYLAHRLFEYSDQHSEARVLLLSATPYKMYTLSHESDEDHYRDFMRTLEFLLNDERKAEEVEALLGAYRRELYRLGDGGTEHLIDLNAELERRLSRVMVRTERLAVSVDRNGMLIEKPTEGLELRPADVESFVSLEGLATILDQYSMLEYWKSAPYLLNFMDDYQFKLAFESASRDSAKSTEIAKMLEEGAQLLSWDEIAAYTRVDPGNARLRALVSDTIETGVWRLLWIPPSLPYYQLGAPFADPDLSGFTKRLVFSSWRVVPNTIATLLSYDAERRMIKSFEEDPENTPEARKRRTRLLRFAMSGDRLTGMPVLGIIYPSPTLARHCDPLKTLRAIKSDGELPTIGELVHRLRERIDGLLTQLDVAWDDSGPADESWYWAAPILLDLEHDPSATHDWFAQSNLAAIWSGEADADGEEDGESRWHDHIELARDLVTGEVNLGRPPDDLSLVLSQMALGGPAITTLRALSRVTGGSEALPQTSVRNGAAQVAWSFLTLFNLPETTALVRGLNAEEPYWRRVLEYCVAGGLQSVLDEYVHVLRESLGLIDGKPAILASNIAEAMSEALTLRTSTPTVDIIDVDPGGGSIALEKRRMRDRFALRFGDDRTKDTRTDQVRAAFNSPFWPFVLATTSVGQEGLDFHQYCHAVVHWNLPSNPVDLEQREGRVHRYKGHAVRKNLAQRHSQAARRSGEADPWESLFQAVSQQRESNTTELVPFWIYPVEGGAKIERYVPAFPLSRDRTRLEALKESLAVYRMVFGQPRQEDLLAYLLSRLSVSEVDDALRDLRIDLSPPPSTEIELLR